MRKNRNRQISTRGDDELDAGGGRTRQEGELREAGGELRNAGSEAAWQAASGATQEAKQPGGRQMRTAKRLSGGASCEGGLAGVLLGHLPEQDEAYDEQDGHAEDAVAA